MTRGGRILNIITGLVIALVGMWLIYDPEKGLYVVAVIVSLTFTLRGFHSLYYYFTMARYMVSGKTSLYRGIIYLDLGLFTSAVADNAIIYIILYLAALHAFAGIVDILRSRESKSVGSAGWKGTVLYGASNILIAAAVVIGGFSFNSIRLVIYIYGAGLIYSAAVRIATAFRKTAIVYIQ